MDAMWVVVGPLQLALGLGWIALLRADRLQPPEERDYFKSRSLRGPTALGACWLVLGRTGLAAGFLAKNRSVVMRPYPACGRRRRWGWSSSRFASVEGR